MKFLCGTLCCIGKIWRRTTTLRTKGFTIAATSCPKTKALATPTFFTWHDFSGEFYCINQNVKLCNIKCDIRMNLAIGLLLNSLKIDLFHVLIMKHILLQVVRKFFRKIFERVKKTINSIYSINSFKKI